MAVDINTYILIVGIFMIGFVLAWFLSGRSKLFLDISGAILVAMILVFGALLIFDAAPQIAILGFIGGSICMVFIGFRIRTIHSLPVDRLRHQLNQMLSSKDFSKVNEMIFTESYDHLKQLFDVQKESLVLLLEIIDELSSYETQTKLVGDSINQLSDKINQDITQIIDNIDENLQSAVIGNEISERLQMQIREMGEQFVQYNHQLSKTINSADILSDHTNLVAVNAAIEAANASGESENFAIVAEGIQRLSSRSKENAAQLIKINNELSRMVSEKMNSITNEFANLDTVIFQIADLSDNVSTLTHQQKNINTELTNQLSLLNKRRELVIKTKKQFIY